MKNYVAFPVGGPLSHTTHHEIDEDGEIITPEPPKPVIPDIPDPAVVTSLSPNTAVAGSAPDITMVVNGFGFTSDSVIVFNGYDEPTTFVNTNQVSTGVKPSLFVMPATCPVAVRNGRRTSNAVNFTFTEKPVVPADLASVPDPIQ